MSNYGIIERLHWVADTPMKWIFSYSQIDDFAMKPRAFMIWWRFAFKIFFRPWPFFFSLSFPTRMRLVRDLLTLDEKMIIWTKPWLMIGKI